MKIQCMGTSMSPFIKDKRLVTLRPVDHCTPLATGDIVAAAVHPEKKIIIHRIVTATPQKFLLKGDNNSAFDGWFAKEDIMGVVKKIEDQNGSGYTPGKYQGKLVALASRTNILQHTLLPGLRFLKACKKTVAVKVVSNINSRITNPERVV